MKRVSYFASRYTFHAKCFRGGLAVDKGFGGAIIIDAVAITVE